MPFVVPFVPSASRPVRLVAPRASLVGARRVPPPCVSAPPAAVAGATPPTRSSPLPPAAGGRPVVDHFRPARPAAGWPATGASTTRTVAGHPGGGRRRRRGRLRRPRRRRPARHRPPRRRAAHAPTRSSPPSRSTPANGSAPASGRGWPVVRCTSACATPTAPTSTPRPCSPATSGRTSVWCPGAEDGRRPALARAALLVRDGSRRRGSPAVAHAGRGRPRWRRPGHALRRGARTRLASARRASRRRRAVDRPAGRLHRRRRAGRRRLRGGASSCWSSGLGTGARAAGLGVSTPTGLGYAADRRGALLLRRRAVAGRTPTTRWPTRSARRPDGAAGRPSPSPSSTASTASSPRDLGRPPGRAPRPVAAAEPGVPIDVIAHSQGGVVARLALEQAGATGALPSAVENLVTLGTPAPGRRLADGRRGPPASGRAARPCSPGCGTPAGGPDSTTVCRPSRSCPRRLPVIAEMRATPMPDGVRFISIGGRWDIDGARPRPPSIPPADDQCILDTGCRARRPRRPAAGPAVTRGGRPGRGRGAPRPASALGEAGRSFAGGRGDPTVRDQPGRRGRLGSRDPGAVVSGRRRPGLGLSPRPGPATGYRLAGSGAAPVDSLLGSASVGPLPRVRSTRTHTAGPCIPRSPSPSKAPARAGSLRNRWEGNPHGTSRHHAPAARGRRPLRTPDPPLEPEDEALHPR